MHAQPSQEIGPARAVLTLAVLAYVIVLAWLTLGPPPSSEVEAVGDRVRQVSVAVSWASLDESATAPSSEVVWGMNAEAVGNLLLLIPLPVLLSLRWQRWWWASIPLGVATSGAIELTQFLMLDHRSGDPADFYWNSVGATVGFAIVVLARSLVATRRGDRQWWAPTSPNSGR